jgi:ribonucleotide monophosphatase NagD (HAD superfamily)
VPFIVGKPERLLFERACAVLGIANTEALMIGDNSDTDIAGAKAFGIRSLQVWPQALEDRDALVPLT